MDRLTRKELKTDQFAKGVGSGVEFLAEHRGQAMRWGVVAVAIVVLGVGVWVYRNHQATQRAELLAKAMQIDSAAVGAPQPPRLNFPTMEEKEKALQAALTDVAVKYPGSQEAAIAQLAVAASQSDKGQTDEAVKTFQNVMDTAPDPYNSVAKSSLAQIYASQGKTDEAEKLLKQLVDNPTMFVSKDQATLDLAQLIGKKNPAEARKLLEPLSASKRSAVSRAAVAAMGAIATNSAPAQSN